MAHILVIDDNDSIRLLVRMILERAGHAVEEAADGVEGVRAFRRREPDLVLCDLFMPRQGGLEVMRELRRERPGVPFIAMSGGDLAAQPDLLPVAERQGADWVLHKPFGQPELLRAVAQRLGPKPADAPPSPGGQ
jgi:CheY-like chemotaxis protein